MKQSTWKSVLGLLLLAGLVITGAGCKSQVSDFGIYRGFSKERYTDWSRASFYLTMRDGVRLAVDVIRPAVDGKAVEIPLPVLWTHARYHRAFKRLGKVLSIVEMSPDLQVLLRHGYVISALAARGTGASFGRYAGAF